MIRCEYCRFWNNSVMHGGPDRDTTGQCCRRAPLVDFRSGLGMFPFTENTDGCGEGEPEPEAKP